MANVFAKAETGAGLPRRGTQQGGRTASSARVGRTGDATALQNFLCKINTCLLAVDSCFVPSLRRVARPRYSIINDFTPATSARQFANPTATFRTSSSLSRSSWYLDHCCSCSKAKQMGPLQSSRICYADVCSYGLSGSSKSCFTLSRICVCCPS